MDSIDFKQIHMNFKMVQNAKKQGHLSRGTDNFMKASLKHDSVVQSRTETQEELEFVNK